MLKIEIHYEAELEIRATAQYYQERVEGLGDKFLDEIEEGFVRIREFPMAWAVYEGEYRRYLLKRFPYGIIYRIEFDSIFIIAVAHQHRKPDYWKTR